MIGKSEMALSSEKRYASDEEFLRLRHTRDAIPRRVWLVLFTVLFERFTFYAATGPFRK